MMEIRVRMVEDGPDYYHRGRRIHKGRHVSSGKWAPVQFGAAKTRLKHALSLPHEQIYLFKIFEFTFSF
jgi:hypothetical protein